MASILQTIQLQLAQQSQQLAHLPAMNAQLQTVVTGLDDVTNKVAHLESRDDSDYGDSEEDNGELDDLALDQDAFFTGEGAQPATNAGRGCRRKNAGNAASILKKSRR